MTRHNLLVRRRILLKPTQRLGSLDRIYVERVRELTANALFLLNEVKTYYGKERNI